MSDLGPSSDGKVLSDLSDEDVETILYDPDVDRETREYLIEILEELVEDTGGST